MSSPKAQKATSEGPTEGQKALIGDLETFLQESISLLQNEAKDKPAAKRTRGRPRVLPSLCLWAGLVVCVLKGFTSQLDLWRLLNQKGLWSYPRFGLSDEAIYDRLEKEGTGGLELMFAQVTQLLNQRLAPFYKKSLAPFATEVVALDETTLDQTARTLPALRGVPGGDDRLMPGKIAALFDLRRQQWRKIERIDKVHQNCKVAARQMLEGLEKGALVLADLGYFGFKWFDDLTEGGYHWISRVREKTSYSVIHCYYQDVSQQLFDGVVWFGSYRSDRAKYAVRLVQFKVGDHLYRYVTNVLDPRQLSLAQIAELYARRWDIEMAFKLLKRELNLHLLWSAKLEVIWQQIWAGLIIAQILQGLRVEIAGRAGVDEFEVSIALLVKYLPEYSQDGQDPVALFVEIGREARFIRPSRRTEIKTPLVMDWWIRALPAGVVLTREPRYGKPKSEGGEKGLTTRKAKGLKGGTGKALSPISVPSCPLLN